MSQRVFLRGINPEPFISDASIIKGYKFTDMPFFFPSFGAEHGPAYWIRFIDLFSNTLKMCKSAGFWKISCGWKGAFDQRFVSSLRLKAYF
jgi:hypothetical protein